MQFAYIVRKVYGYPDREEVIGVFKTEDGAKNFIKNVKNKRIKKLSIRKNEDGSIEQIETEEIVSGGVYYYDQIKYYDK